MFDQFFGKSRNSPKPGAGAGVPVPPPLPPRGGKDLSSHSRTLTRGLLPKFLEELGPAFVGFLIRNGEEAFALHWMTAGLACPEPRVDVQFRLWPMREGDRIFVAVEMPPPLVPGEAHFLAFTVPFAELEAGKGAPPGYFLLERGTGGGTRFVSWEGGEFRDLGEGPPADCVAFMDAVVPRFCGPLATQEFAAEDSVMNAAIARAKERLPYFMEVVASGQSESISVKVPVEEEGVVEHFWIEDCRWNAEARVFEGTLSGEPSHVKTVSEGQTLRATPGELSDWNFVRDGKLHGAFTMRAMLPRMDPAIAAKLRERMADD